MTTEASSGDKEDDIASVADGALREGQSRWFASGRRLNRDRISISDKRPNRTMELPRDRVVAIRHHFLFGEVQFVHDIADLPPYIGFVAGFGGAEFLIKGLRSFDYSFGEDAKVRVRGDGPRKLHWPSILGPLTAGITAFVLAFLFNARLLAFLSKPTIISAGREVSTAELARFMARMFSIAGAVFLTMALVVFLIQRWQMRSER